MVKREDVFIAGITRVADFPFNPVMAIKFAQYVDHLVLAFDGVGGYGRHNGTNYTDGVTWYELFKKVMPFPPTLSVQMYVSQTGAGACAMGDGFLEEMLRKLDIIMPDFVLECEADAMFDYGPAFDQDIEGFINSGADLLWMGNTCISGDGREVPDFPIAPHCRGYRWYPGVYYRDGFCMVMAPPENPTMDGWKERKLHRDDIPQRVASKYEAKTKLQHFPLFTERLERERWLYYGRSHAEHIYICAEMDIPDLSYVEKV
jgi:hypothetical protein